MHFFTHAIYISLLMSNARSMRFRSNISCQATTACNYCLYSLYLVFYNNISTKNDIVTTGYRSVCKEFLKIWNKKRNRHLHNSARNAATCTLLISVADNGFLRAIDHHMVTIIILCSRKICTKEYTIFPKQYIWYS